MLVRSTPSISYFHLLFLYHHTYSHCPCLRPWIFHSLCLAAASSPLSIHIHPYMNFLGLAFQELQVSASKPKSLLFCNEFHCSLFSFLTHITKCTSKCGNLFAHMWVNFVLSLTSNALAHEPSPQRCWMSEQMNALVGVAQSSPS